MDFLAKIKEAADAVRKLVDDAAPVAETLDAGQAAIIEDAKAWVDKIDTYVDAL